MALTVFVVEMGIGAGLAAGSRTGRQVRYALTPLGHALLAAGGAPAGRAAH